jgi:hypothetical protein
LRAGAEKATADLSASLKMTTAFLLGSSIPDPSAAADEVPGAPGTMDGALGELIGRPAHRDDAAMNGAQLLNGRGDSSGVDGRATCPRGRTGDRGTFRVECMALPGPQMRGTGGHPVLIGELADWGPPAPWANARDWGHPVLIGELADWGHLHPGQMRGTGGTQCSSKDWRTGGACTRGTATCL